MKLTKSGATIAAAAAAAFVLGGTAIAPSAHAIGKVHCAGVNACKGTSSCKSGAHACKGQNACKGQGFVQVNKRTCQQLGGKVTK